MYFLRFIIPRATSDVHRDSRHVLLHLVHVNVIDHEAVGVFPAFGVSQDHNLNPWLGILIDCNMDWDEGRWWLSVKRTGRCNQSGC